MHLLRLTAVFLLCCAPLAAHAQAAISEVLWMGSDVSTSDEWLEISRLPCEGECPPIDLSGWTITSVNSSGNEVVVARFTGGTLLAGAPLIVARQHAETSRLLGEPGVYAPDLSLPNTKLLLKLFDAAGTLVDTVDDGVGAPFAGANPSGGTKASMQRVDLARPGAEKDNWRTATAASGFDEGALVLGSPGALEEGLPEPPPAGSGGTLPPPDDPDSGSGSTPASRSGSVLPPPPPAEYPRVIVHAALPNPAGKDELGEWIELKNLSPDAAVLTSWKLKGEGSSGAPKFFALDGKLVAGTATLRLSFAETQLSMTNTKFTVSLLDPAGTEVSSVSWDGATEDRAYRPNLYAELAIRATVSRVIDGDTLEVVFDETPAPDARTIATVRLIGVDAPESVHPTRKPEPYGTESAIFLRGLLEKKKVELQFDTENWDAYDRLLAYVTVDEQILAQERLLGTGLARVYPDYPFARRGLFDQYEAHAKARKVGIWSSPSSTPEYKAPVALEVAAIVTGHVPTASGTVTPKTGAVFEPAWSDMRIGEIYAYPLKQEALPAIGEHDRRIRAILLQEEWIEVRNAADAPISLRGWKIRVGEGSGARNYALKTQETVPSDGIVVLPGSAESFKLRDDGNAVALVAPDGTIVSATAYPKLKAGQAWLPAEGCVTDDPTPGAENRCVAGSAPKTAAKTTTRKTAKPKASAAKKTTAKKPPSPDFVLAQRTLESLQARTGTTLSLGGSGGGFWQAFSMFLGVVSVCQGGLMAAVAWRSGLLSGVRKLTFGSEGPSSSGNS